MSNSSTILVVGAGLIGVHTAWYLKKAGFDVTLIDEHNGVAQETSFANGAQLSYGHVEPWASKDTYPLILKALWDDTSPIWFRPRWDLNQWRWALSFIREGGAQRYQINLEKLLSLAMRSREAHRRIQNELHIDYKEEERGIIHLYTDPSALERGIRQAQAINHLGYPRYPLSVEEIYQREPSLQQSSVNIVGGTFCPEDASGNARVWTEALNQAFITAGGQFLSSMKVSQLWVTQGACQGVILNNQERLNARAVVLCTGVKSKFLLEPLKVHLPIYPVKGYSITLPITDSEKIPFTSLTDDQQKMVMTRLGDELRVAGTAEFAGWDDSLNQRRIDALVKRTREWFPKGLDYSHITSWAGLRPVTPSGYPIIGESTFSRLFLNVGHGTLGWTLSAGSAEVLTEKLMATL